jgi:hypothetical protein
MVDMRSVSPEEGAALLDVTRRLTVQIEHQLAQLRRLRDAARADAAPGDAGLGELQQVSRRMRRDAERMRLLCGEDPVVGDAKDVAEVLGEAVSATAAPVRVTMRPAPVATVAARAAVELAHVLAEVLDGALAESALGVTVGGRLGPAGLTVDVTVEGRRREPGRVPSSVAEALARRSSVGVQVHRSGPDGPYAIVLCPAASLTVPPQRRTQPPAMYELGAASYTRPETTAPEPPARPDPFAGPVRPDPLSDPLPPVRAQRPDPFAGPLRSEPPARRATGTERPGVPASQDAARSDAIRLPQRLDPKDPLGVDRQARPRTSLGGDMFGVRATGSAGGAALFGAAPPGAAPPGAEPTGAAPPGLPPVAGTNGRPTGGLEVPPAAAKGRGGGGAFGSRLSRPDVPPVRPPAADPLFGPLPTRGRVDDRVPTPIYEAVASAWFREADDGVAPAWESPGDTEWRDAAARAAQAEELPGPTTASGLPRRRPGRQMVTPPLQRTRSVTTPRPEERAPDRVRERLDGYQRGLRQGRHRASEPEPPAGRATRWA